jgi:hypothetical protein
MKGQTQQTQSDTKLGTLDSFQEERDTAKKLFNKLEQFRDDVQIAKMMAQQEGESLPIVEADKDLIAFHNKGKKIDGFDSAGYFLYEGVVICEKGKKEHTKKHIEQTSTQDNFTLRQQPK